MNSERFADAEMLALLKLANHLHDLPPNLVVRHERMLSELCRLTGATSGTSALLNAPSDESPSVVFVAYHGLQSAQQQTAMQKYRRALETPPSVPPPLSRLLETRAWELAPRAGSPTPNPNGFESLDDARELCRSLDFGPSIVSTLPLDGTKLISLLSIHRPLHDDRQFSARQHSLVQLFHSQIGWTFREQLPVEPGAAGTLSPRQQQTLRHLLAGNSEKQIAQKLARSRHTVHTYVKAIYRNFRVSSRGELLSLFVR